MRESPSDPLHVTASSGSRMARFEASQANSFIAFKDSNTNVMPTIGCTTDALELKTASSGDPALGLKIDANGHVTKPLQTAFSAGRSSTLTNVATDSMVTTNLNSEIYDVNSDFSDPNFTAPVTGKYQLSAVVYFNQLDADAGYYIIRINTSNRVYDRVINMAGRSDENYSSYVISVLADMDASDTAYISTLQSGGAAQTDITAGTYFTGFLAC